MSELLMTAAPLVGGAISGYGSGKGNKEAAKYAAQAAANANPQPVRMTDARTTATPASA